MNNPQPLDLALVGNCRVAALIDPQARIVGADRQHPRLTARDRASAFIQNGDMSAGLGIAGGAIGGRAGGRGGDEGGTFRHAKRLVHVGPGRGAPGGTQRGGQFLPG